MSGRVVGEEGVGGGSRGVGVGWEVTWGGW